MSQDEIRASAGPGHWVVETIVDGEPWAAGPFRTKREALKYLREHPGDADAE